MQLEIMSFAAELEAAGRLPPAARHWLSQPALAPVAWKDPDTDWVYDLRPPLPLATNDQWLRYGDEFIGPLLKRYPSNARLQLHGRLAAEVLAWREAQPEEARIWRQSVSDPPTDPLEWFYNQIPSLAADLEDVPRDRRFWRMAHPEATPPYLPGLLWHEFHPMSSNERWEDRRREMLAFGLKRCPGYYSFDRYLEDIDYLLGWRELVPAEHRPWRTRIGELALRHPETTFH